VSFFAVSVLAVIIRAVQALLVFGGPALSGQRPPSAWSSQVGLGVVVVKLRLSGCRHLATTIRRRANPTSRYRIVDVPLAARSRPRCRSLALDLAWPAFDAAVFAVFGLRPPCRSLGRLGCLGAWCRFRLGEPSNSRRVDGVGGLPPPASLPVSVVGWSAAARVVVAGGVR